VRLANQHALILLAGFVVAIVAAGVASSLVPEPGAIFILVACVAFNVTVVRRRAWKWIWHRAGIRLQRAFAREDIDAALEIIDSLSAQSPTTAVREQFVANRGVAMIMDEQWKSGIAVLRGLDRKLVTKSMRLLIDNAIAWALIHDGAIEEGLGLARATVDAARVEPAIEPKSRGACIGTLGAALVLANMPEAGIGLLREALALVGPPRTQATRLLYIGDAEQALGRAAEARAAWEEAARLAPDSRWGRRAAERLKSAPPMPYR